MKTKLTLIGTMAVACAAFQLTAMPTEMETRRAELVVRKLLGFEKAELEVGRKTRSEVAAVAMKLSGEADTEAAKLLLMKGAFVLYVQDGNLEKAAETMKTLKATIPDLPSQSVKNMIEAALLGVPKKEDGARLYKLLDEEKAETTTAKTRKDVAKLFPGWSLDSEVPQENNKDVASGLCANHRGQENVLRLHPLNKETPVVLSRTVTLSNKNPCLFLKVSSWNAESDFLLSVRVNGKDAMAARLVRTTDLEPWEDLVVPLFDWRGRSAKIEIILKANNWNCEWSHFARIEIAEGNGQETCGLVGVKYGTETVDGYTWSYFVKNGEATVAAEKNGEYSCAVSPSPKGAITIPKTLGGVKVTGIGYKFFYRCEEVTSVTIPEGVTCIGPSAFDLCFGLKSVTIPSSVKTIGAWAFSACFQMQPLTLPESLEYIGKGAFINCRSLKRVNIPAKLAVIGNAAFAYCTGLEQFNVDVGNKTFTAIDGVLYSKDWSTLVSAPNVSTIARMPSTVTKIGASAFQGRDRLEALTIPESVTIIDHGAFHSCERLGSMTIPASVTKIGPNAFDNCGELTEVTMLGERLEAPEALFPRCGKLKSIHVPANAKSWAGMKEWQGLPLVFDAQGQTDDSGCGAKDIKYKFSYKLEDEFAVITGVEPKPVGKLVVPYEIDGHTVVQIGGYNDNMFSDCDQMTGIVLPAGLELETFDPGVFMRCKSLASIEVEKANLDFASLDGVLYSKDFSMLCVYPKTRESIELSPMTKRIMRCAFRGCALKTAKIPEGIEEIERWNLCECPNLESAELPESLKSLECCAVAHSKNVKKMVFNGDAPRADPTYYTSGLVQSVFTGAPADLVVEVREGTKGWMSPDSTELPECWPTDQNESRSIRYIE